ncbi:serine protease 3-like [Hyposmocoma kahamanoa]|uniref:serine protease 3-like n=1 Tax=Hyposmocoma kahamanoa TaxID=1477025 RepID=UPI000E6D652C|nr:serine protease 3-like [Hyposmocoma kahamanoa]
MAAVYIIGFLCALGLVQGSIVNYAQPVYVEQLRSGSVSRVVGGWEAKPGQIPHQVSVRMNTDFAALVQPCRLQQSASRVEEYVGTRLTVSGYGLTDDAVNGGTSVEHLRWVFLRGISLAECRTWYPTSQAIVESTVCAEYYNHTSQSACQGDSGGPLSLVDLDGKPTMVGVVSFGSSAGCNSPWPSAYVRPEFYHDWFTEITGINFDWRREDFTTSEPTPVTIRSEDTMGI